MDRWSTVTIVPMMGLSPLSHMGHYIDMGVPLIKASREYGDVIVGVSAKNDSVFTDKERVNVLSRQWTKGYHNPNVKFITVQSAGETVAYAYDYLTDFYEKKLNIFVGSDRIAFGEGLRDSIRNGKIPELCGGKFDEVDVIGPTTDRTDHGLSGTRMRVAARDGDFPTFREHIGDSFSADQIQRMFERTRAAIEDGRLKVKRT